MAEVKLWLDDDLVYKKAPPGWVHVQTVAEAQALLEAGGVSEIDLDHDLSVCEEHCHEDGGGAIRCDLGPPLLMYCPCPCHDTGYELVKWMMEKSIWPSTIRIHSNNPVGRQNMQETILRHAPPGTYKR